MRLGGAVWLALAVLACAPAAPTGPTPAVSEDNWLLPGAEWLLVSLGGAPFAGRVTATLTADGRVIGEAPCNGFVAPYSGRWPNLTFAPAATTRRACPDLGLENEFFAALAAVNRAALSPDGLTLSGPDGTALRFKRIA